MIKLTEKQLMWVDQAGGRTLRDVKRDDIGLFVLMSSVWGRPEKIYLPEDEALIKKRRKTRKNGYSYYVIRQYRQLHQIID